MKKYLSVWVVESDEPILSPFTKNEIVYFLGIGEQVTQDCETKDAGLRALARATEDILLRHTGERMRLDKTTIIDCGLR